MTSLLLEFAVIALALTIDTLVAAVAYGSEKIKIPISSAIIISATSTIIVGLSAIVGSLIFRHINYVYIKYIAFALLFLLGFSKIIAELKQNTLKLFSLCPLEKSVLLYLSHLSTDSTRADLDNDKYLSRKEALSLALVLSLDGGVAGLSVGMSENYQALLLIIIFVMNLIAIILGCKCGNLLAKKSKFSISWLGGIILMALAVAKL